MKSVLHDQRSAGSGVSEINVAPLIDVLLVLFIIFLAAVLLGRRTLPVRLPEPDPGLPGTEVQLVLRVAPGGGYRLNGQPVPGADLAGLLTTVNATRQASMLFIDADPAVRYQDVIAVMDLARGAGVRIVALMPPSQPGAVVP
ncbi:MAG: ExbD/TolR family protein [Gemmatimonadales bacterium]